MAESWKNVADVRAFLSAKGSRRSGPHNLSCRIISWPYCKNCGLVALKNEATRSALKRACVWED